MSRSSQLRMVPQVGHMLIVDLIAQGACQSRVRGAITFCFFHHHLRRYSRVFLLHEIYVDGNFAIFHLSP